MLPDGECSTKSCPEKGATYPLRFVPNPELEGIEVKKLLHTDDDLKAVPNLEPITVSWRDTVTELDLLANKLGAPTSDGIAVNQMQGDARRLELLKLRQAIEFECEVARQTEEMKQYALAQARATSTSIASTQRVEHFGTIGLNHEAQDDSGNIITYAVLHLSSALPWEKPGAAEFGSTEGVEVKEMLLTDRDIIAKVTVEPQPEPITVTWNGMWAELALISQRQVQRQESPNVEALRADRLKDDVRVFQLLRVREAIRKECMHRLQGSQGTAVNQHRSPPKLPDKKD